MHSVPKKVWEHEVTLGRPQGQSGFRDAGTTQYQPCAYKHLLVGWFTGAESGRKHHYHHHRCKHLLAGWTGESEEGSKDDNKRGGRQ